ncbi:3-oxoacid CoA-transferase subunit B [Streptomyces sp. NPDC058683]|uniref:3-oxoacid CoA-transferase subunit B n=1 Tax=Streptomyces sp. NPDC058683 TaxID=3346597 RepID=UPI0036531602
MNPSDIKNLIARRAAAELHDGDVVNLGIGIPTLIPTFLDGRRVHLHSESGLLGVGPPPSPDEFDPDLVDAGRQPVTAAPGASCFSSTDAFAMIRGGHVDATVLGALQISRRGDLASWMVPGRDVLGVGGAMDLAIGARKVIVATTHRDSAGRSKLVPQCTYPLTAEAVVDTVVTELAVLDVRDGQLVLRELQPGVTKDHVAAATEAPFDSAI